MRAPAACALAVAACVGLAGAAGPAWAGDGPSILLQLAERARDQIADQLPGAPGGAAATFAEGAGRVALLEEAVLAGDDGSAEAHFAAAMAAFTEASSLLPEEGHAQQAPAGDPTSDFKRLHAYVQSLRDAAAVRGAQADFAGMDGLFGMVLEQIHLGRYAEASGILDEIRRQAAAADRELRDEAARDGPERARGYALKYLGQLDRLMEGAAARGAPGAAIAELGAARDGLAAAEDPGEIVGKIRDIIGLKERLGLTGHDALESRILRAEGAVLEPGRAGEAALLGAVKDLLRAGELGGAGLLMDGLEERLDPARAS